MMYLISFVLVLTLAGTSAGQADPDLVGWWKLDEGSGGTAYDSSGYGNDGTLVGDSQWVPGYYDGAIQFDGIDDYIDCGNSTNVNVGNMNLGTGDGSICAWIKFSELAPESWQDTHLGSIISKGYLGPEKRGHGLCTENEKVTYQARANDLTAEITSDDSLMDGNWHHIAAVLIRDKTDGAKMYVDGVLQSETGDPSVFDGMNLDNDYPFLIGTCDGNWDFNGDIDDVRIYTRALTQNEVKYLIGGTSAGTPSPADGATDVPRDVVTSWTPAEFAATHDVYFGTVFEDVNTAGAGSPLLLGPAQDANTYSPSRLELGTTYYWRVDEVNAPPDSTIFKGKVWSFTVEPVAYKVPPESITATASSYMQDNEPNKTVDGSGLVDDLHMIDTKTMWLSETSEPGAAWIQYDFDKLYKLHQMLVWNYNGSSILIGFSLKDVTIEYSEDGQNWTVLPDANEFAQAPGTNGYQYDTTVDFNGVVAQSVKITANSNWGGTMFAQYGLSEVRFFYIPVNAREPNPDSGTTDIGIDNVTLGWRAGRDAVLHEVYLSTDEQAVMDESVSPVSVPAGSSYVSYDTGALDLDKTYYWKVNEVNEAETPAAWAGDIWDFTTEEYIVVDDFESYNDLNPDDPESDRIFLTWIGGDDQPANGLQVGNNTFPFAEETVVNNGDQSMPLLYNNSGTATYLEAELPLESEDWTKHGIKTLVLSFHGTSGNTGQLSVKVNGVEVPYPGDAADISRPRWRQWNIDLESIGVDLQNVMTLGIRIDGNGAMGTLYVDDIRLYKSVTDAVATEEIWVEAEDGTITAPFNVFSAIPGASGGEYLEVESGNNSTGGPPETGGVASYAITVQGGTYKINCRVIAPSGSNDSLWVRIQGATTQTGNHSSGWVRWNGMAGGTDWQWDFVHSSEDGNAEVEWTMDAGTYTLDIGYREEGALVDAFVVTKIVLPPPPSEVLWIEAEDASPIGLLIQVVDDPAASGGKYITVEPGNNSTSEPNIPDGIAAWTFTVEGGTYKIEALLTTLADDDGDDSCWFRIQGAEVNRTIHSSGWVRHNDARPRGGPWALDEVHSSEDGDQTVYFTLSPGTHTLEWGYREDGLFLDAIKISNVVE